MARRVTLKQVAQCAGVSFQTVSKFINGQAQVSETTAARIRLAIATLDYRPDAGARNLRTRRSRLIGFTWDSPAIVQAGAVLGELVPSMVQAAERAGYHLMPFACAHGSDELPDFRDLIGSHAIDALVLLAPGHADPRIALVESERIPCVTFGRAGGASEIPYVDIDDAEGARRATEHLITRGHRRIAVLAWPASSVTGEHRLSGYVAALHDAGLSPNPEWMVRGEHRARLGYEAAMNWLDCPLPERPTAIVALDDLAAAGAMHAVQERGLAVGPDVAITGFGDLPLAAQLTPALTSVRQPIHAAGQEIITLVVNLLSGATRDRDHVRLTPELVVRASSE